MANITPNLKLTIPGPDDWADIEVLSQDLEKIDAAYGNMKEVHQTHTQEKNNPHSVTKAQVGLDKADNTADLDKPVSRPQSAAIQAAKQVGTDANNQLSAHKAARNNPHGVTAAQAGADPKGTADNLLRQHNTSGTAHNDIRSLIAKLSERLSALANSDDKTLDQMAEVVTYIKSNRSLIESITTTKVSKSDIVNNLTTNIANQPLSAAQGVALLQLIHAISIPSKLPAPYALTLTTCDKTQRYDGSSSVTVDIPAICTTAVRAPGSYPASYDLPFEPSFVILWGFAAGNKRALTFARGPSSNGAAVTIAGTSGLVTNWKISVVGNKVTLHSDPGNAIAGAHNVSGSYECIIAFRQ